jgi:hypothetical protein
LLFLGLIRLFDITCLH